MDAPQRNLRRRSEAPAAFPTSVRFCRIILSTAAATAAESLRLTFGRGRCAVGLGVDDSELQDFSPFEDSFGRGRLAFWVALPASLFSLLVGASSAAKQVATQNSRLAMAPRLARNVPSWRPFSSRLPRVAMVSDP